MALLAADSTNVTIMGTHPDDTEDLRLKAGEADTFYRYALALIKGDGLGLTVIPAAASGDKWGGLVLASFAGAVIGDRIRLARRLLVRIKNLTTAIANAQDLEGKPVYMNFALASDNPIDVTVVAPGAGAGIMIGRGVEHVSTTEIIVELGDLSAALTT